MKTTIISVLFGICYHRTKHILFGNIIIFSDSPVFIGSPGILPEISLLKCKLQ